MRVGVVGLGSIARRAYLPVLASHPRIELIGVASRTGSTVAEWRRRLRVPLGTTDLDELLRSGPDLVFVHAPTPAHHEIVTRCLDAGVAVYVDKPLSDDLALTEQLTALAERRGLLLAVGFNRRFAPGITRARDWIGNPRHVAIEKHRAEPTQAPARFTVYDDLIHLLDLLVWLGDGAVELEHARVEKDPEGRLRTATGAVVLPGNATGSFAMHRHDGRDSERLVLHGDGASAVVEELELLTLSRDGTTLVEQPGSWATVGERRGFAALVDHVLDTVASPERCEVHASHVLATHRLAERLAALDLGP
jgi:virulence factor